MKKLIALSLAALSICAGIKAQTATSDDNPLANVSQNPGLCSIFHYWGFIGDSLCSGEFEYTREDGKTGYWDCYEYSWGMRMCDLMGVKGEVYSKGGETAKGWIEHFWDSADNAQKVCAKGNPKQAYIIALGVNDSNPKRTDGYALGSFETDICLGDYNQNAKTFIGSYAGIIQRLKEQQPEVKIFLVTMPRKGERYDPYNTAIREMATLFDDIWLLDLERYASDYYASPEFNALYYPEGHGHLNPAGYEYTAWEFMTYIDWIIRHDPIPFKEVGFMLPSAPKRID